ncbi:MAG: hypothetical protein IPM29_06990 [Planctomycetes bacterium]|nr:hypothetical protein [Planctomycetota bacterium]
MHIALTLIAACGLLLESGVAQCSQWRAGLPFPGIDGPCTKALTANPGGAGTRVFVAGAFHSVGGVNAANLAAFDPATGGWSTVGGGTNDTVADLDVLPNGDLVAGGSFTRAGSAIGSPIAVWNGATWTALGAAGPLLLPGVGSIAVTGSGVVCASTSNGLAVVVGSSANLLTATINGFPVTATGAVEADPTSQNRVVVSFLDTANNRGVAFVDVSTNTWTFLRYTLGGEATAFAFVPGGMFVGGGFTSISTTGAPTGPARNFLAFRNNLGAWPALVGPGILEADAPVLGLTVLTTGDVLVGGVFTTLLGTATPGAGLIAAGTLATVTPLGGVFNSATSGAVLPNGNLLVAGAFEAVGPAMTPAANVAVRVPGTGAWATATGSNRGLFTGPGGIANGAPVIFALRAFRAGTVAGGRFSQAGGQPAANLASWDGANWTPVGGGCNGDVNALAVLRSGELIVGGAFTTVGAGVPAVGVAQWNGTAWRALGTGLAGTVNAVLETTSGRLLVGGVLSVGGVPTGVAAWNGVAWSIPGGGIAGTVNALAEMPNGDVVAGGTIPGPNGLLVWNGVQPWRPTGSPNGRVLALLTRRDGTLAIGGDFTSLGGLTGLAGVASYDGASFGAYGRGLSVSGSVRAFVETVSGELLAGGSFTAGAIAPSTGIARFDGTNWVTVQRGVDRSVFALERVDDLTVLAGGDFSLVGGLVSTRLATLASTCLPNIAPFDLGATGCGTLTAANLPMVGSTFRANATGLPAPAFALAIRGFAAPSPVPLTTAFPSLPTTCALLIDPNLLIVDNFFTTTGSLQTEFAIANIPVNIGLVLSYQVVALEVDAQLNILSTAATDALRLTIGAF